MARNVSEADMEGEPVLLDEVAVGYLQTSMELIYKNR
jgi:hypothetical protein